MKSICWYDIWSYKNTNLLNVCVVLFFLHILYSISTFSFIKREGLCPKKLHAPIDDDARRKGGSLPFPAKHFAPS